MCQYLYAFNAAMTGRLDVTRATLARLEVTADAPETETMRGAIEAIIERADRVAGVCALDDKDLRGWQYVLTGSLVIHQSPYGFDEPMHGRYAWLQDSNARIATAIDRLKPLAGDVPCVYAPAGRDHEILAHAVAKRLDLPLAEWPTIGVPAPGLVVVYDLAELPRAELTRLLPRRTDQILFAHASPWTSDFPIAPDITTLLYQSIVAPWAEHVTTAGRGDRGRDRGRAGARCRGARRRRAGPVGGAPRAHLAAPARDAVAAVGRWPGIVEPVRVIRLPA
jgi:hypothetical protein